jgi:hypothetical protein
MGNNPVHSADVLEIHTGLNPTGTNQNHEDISRNDTKEHKGKLTYCVLFSIEGIIPVQKKRGGC